MFQSPFPDETGKLEVVQYWDSAYNYVMFEDNKVYGDVWIEAMVDLPNNVTEDESYVIRIQAYVGSSSYSKSFIYYLKCLKYYCIFIL